MSNQTPQRRSSERFGSYNDFESDPMSDSEGILDIRNGVLDPYKQIVQSTLRTSYTVISSITTGDVFRARILGLAVGKPARHFYPKIYENTTTFDENGTPFVQDYIIFVLRNESDQFAPEPRRFASSVSSYVNSIGLQGSAISEKPASETLEAYGVGDIVYVRKKPNTWRGARVIGVAERNNYSEDVVTGSGTSFYFGASGSLPFGGAPFSGGTTSVSRRPSGLTSLVGDGFILYEDSTNQERFPLQNSTTFKYRLGDNGRPMDFGIPHRSRNPDQVMFITLHNAGNRTAESLGNYWRTNDRGVSSHIGVGEDGVQQYLPLLDTVTFHAGYQNQYAIGLDICQPYDPNNERHRRAVESNLDIYGSLSTVTNPLAEFGRGPTDVYDITDSNLNNTAIVIVSILRALGKDLILPSVSEIVNGGNIYTVEEVLQRGWVVVPHSATQTNRYDVVQWWAKITERLRQKWNAS